MIYLIEANLAKFPGIDFDANAETIFDKLVTDRRCGNIGRGDLPAACIALSFNAVLVTRNVKDFSKVPNLVLENWAV